MDVFYNLQELPAGYRGAVAAIGNFDGVHKGHQILLGTAKEYAEEKGRPFGILTFEPHPRHLFRPDDPPFRITPAKLKLERLAMSGADFALVIAFDWDFASQRPEDFIEGILVRGLDVSHVVVGDSFRFGQLRKGTPGMLKEKLSSVAIVESEKDDGSEILSSSRIRAELRHGEIAAANSLLGWPWEIQGSVVHGDKRGRKLGFPTANVALGETLHPGYGVYAAWVRIEEDGPDAPWLPSATNIGIRPMFEVAQGHAEAFIFDFDRDIYYKTLRIRPVMQIRGEAKFPDVSQLVRQMELDCEEVQRILKLNPPKSTPDGVARG